MKRLAKGNQPETLEEFEATARAAVAAAVAEWETAWAEGLPMPSRHRLPYPFGEALNAKPWNAD